MDKNKKNLLILIIIILIASAGVYTLSRALGLVGGNTKEVSSAPKREIVAPDFTLGDKDGREYSLSDFKGKYVILNFWGSWCSFCVKEMPDFERANATFEKDQDTVIILINDTSTERSKEEAIAFIEDRNYTMLVLYDLDGSIAETYNVRGYPTTYVIDKEGYIYGYQAGSLTEKNLYDVIDILREE
jgi:peroxiredoxin